MAAKSIQATFALKLQDEMSGPARTSAKSLNTLKEKIDEDTIALRQMRKALRNMKGGTVTSAAAFKELKAQIDAKRASIATAQSTFVEAGGTFGRQAEKSKTKMQEFAERITAGERPVGMLKAKLMTANPVMLAFGIGAVAAAAAVVAVGAAAAAAAVKITRYAIASADAHRSEALRLEGLNTLYRHQRRWTVDVQQTQAAVDRASDSTNVGREALIGYARSLGRAGLRGRALQGAVEAMGMAAQVQGERGAGRFLMLARSARLAGRSVQGLVEDYRRRLGPIARRQMLSIDNQQARFQRNLSRLFRGLRIEGFLEGLSRIGDLFSQNAVTGRALKQLMETVLQPVIDAATRGLPSVMRFFQRQVIGAQTLIIWYLRTRNRFNEMVDGLRSTWEGFGDNFSIAGLGSRLMQSGEIILDGFRRIFDAERIAGFIGDGLIAGLRLSIGPVGSAVFDLASSLQERFKDALGIRSPSRVFAGFGGNITEGLVRGMAPGPVQRQAGRLADGAMQGFDGSLGAPSLALASTASGAATEAAASGSAHRGATSITIGDVHVHVSGHASTNDIAGTIREALADALRGLSLEMGAPA